ncbi:MAG: phosphoribosyltransferase family protein [Candidatus Levyibacteriota bacterium]
MRFRDRTEAGQLLAQKLKKYIGKDVVVYALPRGGVVTAVEIAKELHAPLDLIITRKISHPHSPEYAIAATAENGHIVGTRRELLEIDEEWLEGEIERQRKEAARRRKNYLHGREILSPQGKIAILVDDGVATGLTLRVGILELKHRNPSKLIVAVPVVPKSTAKILEKEADELVALEIPTDDNFLGAVSAYYESFPQVEDEEVIKTLDEHKVGIFTIKNGRQGSIIDYDEP